LSKEEGEVQEKEREKKGGITKKPSVNEDCVIIEEGSKGVHRCLQSMQKARFTIGGEGNTVGTKERYKRTMKEWLIKEPK